MMRILSLNVRSGGGTRTEKIIEYLDKKLPDVIVLSEFRKNAAGDKIRAWLDNLAFSYQIAPVADHKKNTVLVAGRRIESVVLDAFPNDWSATVVRINDVRIIGVYFPQEEKKQPVFDWFLRYMPDMKKAVVIGDFNTGLNDLDRENSVSTRFYCQDEFKVLSTDILVDAYRYCHLKKREYSWYSQKHNGFRIDHALLTHDLVKSLSSVGYDHTTRQAITDHSGLFVNL
ncbi:MAG: endonuclease/exonuclease/phosphatase family protein [Pseudomonadota bacterium]